jgi:ABC-type nitrate/sulfonate/bicarbonate transport system substrate-binding protein
MEENIMAEFPAKQPLRLSRRDVLKRGGGGALGLFLAAGTANIAGVQVANAQTVKANLSSIKMGDFNPNYSNQWVFRLAQALAYYEEGGIEEFEIILSDEYIAGLVGGSLDIAHGDTSEFLAAAHASGLPIKIISMHRDSEWWIMGVRNGIETTDQLRGGTITGGNMASRNTWIQRQLLIGMGIDPDNDIQFVPASGGSDARLGALLNGQVDAASVFPRHRAPLEAAGGKFIHEELVSAPQEAFAVMGDWLEENSDTARAWILADLKARAWLLDPSNTDKAFEIMIDFGYEIPDDFRALKDVQLAQLSRDGGFKDAAAMDEFVAQLAITGALPADLDWRQHFDFTHLWAAQEELGLARRPAML